MRASLNVPLLVMSPSSPWPPPVTFPFLFRHALSTDCDLSKAPRRRTDGAIVLDTDFYVIKLYTTDGDCKLLKRKSGQVERQHRVNLGLLPIAYR